MSFWDSWGISGVGYDALEGSDGEKERLRRVQGRIQLGKVQRVKRTDLVMGVERGHIWVHVHDIMNAWIFCGQGDIQNRLLVGALREKPVKEEGERRLVGEMETTSNMNEKERQWKPGTYHGGKRGRGGTDRRDRGMETDALNGKDEEEGGEGEEER